MSKEFGRFDSLGADNIEAELAALAAALPTSGVWTPTWYVESGGTLSSNAGSSTYTKTKDIVVCQCRLNTSAYAGSPAGNIGIGGLPFTVHPTANNGPCFVHAILWDGATKPLFCVPVTNTNRAHFFKSAGTISQFTDMQSGGLHELIVNIIYKAAS